MMFKQLQGLNMKDSKGNWTVCCIKGCDKTPDYAGLCVNHYRIMIKNGSPVAQKMAHWRWLRMSYEERFWQNVEKNTTPQGCWDWHAGRDFDGYGAFDSVWDGKKYTKAHRFSFALHHSHPPKGMHVCHRCDRPSCVNPDHLLLGSPLDNMRDKIAKGRARTPFGENASRAVLTEEQVKIILADPRPSSRISAEYNVTTGTINDIKRRVSWSHLGNDRGVKAVRVSPNKGVSNNITPDMVREIRSGKSSGKDLAAKYNVTPQTITDIRKRRSWAHVPADADETTFLAEQAASAMTDDMVREIRASTERGVDIARRFGIAKGAVSGIRLRHTYAHVPDTPLA
jgi:hypothetical protein